ncbi:MAG: substrate-binding domain-containing protein [Actinomycetota bacterium]|nr:substrate-binding domain-containing protein [Actinomycetota bacterium]
MGLIVPDISSPFYSDLVKGISSKLQSLGYEMYLCNSNNNLEKEYEIIENLKSMWVDGLILIPVYDHRRDLNFFDSLSKPLVILNRDLGETGQDTVLFNNFSGAYRATSYLLDKGHRDVLCLNGPKNSNSAMERYKGWKKAMNERAVHKEDFIFWGNFSISSGKKMMAEALGKFSCIDAVFATSDLIALGAIKTIASRNLAIPEDISIMGFGDIYICQYLNPPLTTVARPFEATGIKAVEVLVDRIKNPDLEPARIVIDGEIEERNSVSSKSSNPCPGRGLLT